MGLGGPNIPDEGVWWYQRVGPHWWSSSGGVVVVESGFGITRIMRAGSAS